MSGSAFRVDSDEGREVILEIEPALLDADEPLALELGGELPKIRLRMTNDEAADLLIRLDGQIGEWLRERGDAHRSYAESAYPFVAVGRADGLGQIMVSSDGGETWHGLQELDPSDPDHPQYAESAYHHGDQLRKERLENG